MISFALGLPHTPWNPDRITSFAALRTALGCGDPNDLLYQRDYLPAVQIFDDRESNRIWPGKLWRWALSTSATHLLQLQDDVIVAPNFWPALRAMVEAQPDRIIGLHANHPLAVVQFAAGRRWYRDRWLTGPAYVFPRARLAAFVAWCDANEKLVAETNEDSLISHWATQANVDVWHPVPTITDVDQGIPSTYGNDDHHEWSMFRRPFVSWRDATTLHALEDPAFWRCTVDAAPLLPGPGTQLCWFCGQEQGKLTSQATGARLGPACLAKLVGVAIGRL